MIADGVYEFDNWEDAFKKQHEHQEYCLNKGLDFKDMFLITPPHASLFNYHKKYKIIYWIKIE